MLIVIAIGGNSLIEDPKHISVPAQFAAAQKSAAQIVKLIVQGHRVVIVHGNGPQVGFILRRAEYAKSILHPVPLDCCVADTQGAIGYNLQMGLFNEFDKLGMQKPAATIVTQVLVDPQDPSFQNPTKPIGSFMTKEEADIQVLTEGWSVKEDAGRGYRRVVASPKPLQIIEQEAIEILIKSGVIVIAAGGGGIPVTKGSTGLSPQEAVVDKDFAAALLAKSIGADLLIISTAVEKACINFGKPNQISLSNVTIQELEEFRNQGHFAPGSMLPKIEAMIDFIKDTGKRGIITDPAHLTEALSGESGTHIKQ